MKNLPKINPAKALKASLADPEKRNVNLNVLVIGGSGSGKTRYHIKPNLLQMNWSR